MCILFIAVEQHENYPLIIAANRDEFYQRPTLASNFWDEQTDILAGKDLQAGGTWMGINKSGYLSALTNYRDPANLNPNAPSRGDLVADYLKNPNQDYLSYLQQHGRQFNGFNLLFGHWKNLTVFNNTNGETRHLGKGVYGLSNAMLDTPWPKLTSGVEGLKLQCSKPGELDREALFKLLGCEQKASKKQLPDTGVGEELELALSSIFINLSQYGTRSSTLLTINRDGLLEWQERSFNEEAEQIGEERFQLVLN